VRVAVDVMGGDHAPKEILLGCWEAASLLDGDDLVHLVGDEKAITAGLDGSGLSPEQKKHFTIVPTTQVIAMDDHPVEAIRAKPDSSISVMCKLASKKQVEAVISAGNTGACVAAAQMRMRLLPGVSRPGIAVAFPTYHGPVVVCDVGANITPKPKHLMQYAIMAGAYASVVVGKNQPRVGLLSIGEEDTKGTTMVKDARKLMRDEPQINFIGNVEGKDLFRGAVDVVVCDGFVGNIVLKCTEGMADGLFKTIATEIKQVAPEAADLFKPVLKKIYARHDWQEYGGAPLLGVDGYCLISHGRSEARAIKNAIGMAKKLIQSRVNEKIVAEIGASIPVEE